MSNEKTLRSYAKDAKGRLKTKFWQDYKDNLTEKLNQNGVSDNEKNKVAEYYREKVATTVKGVNADDEIFYAKVKELLLKFGEVSDAIGRLTDVEYYNSLNYEQRQRYVLELSGRYLKMKERFYKEAQFEKVN